MPDATETATAETIAAPSSQIDVPLSEPIQRGETRIEALQLRKPKAGELRGLSLQDVITSDITALLTLIPRISNPPLVKHEVDQLDPADLAEIGGAIRGFFMTASERKLLEAMVAEQRPSS